jgi:hypothetical protein
MKTSGFACLAGSMAGIVLYILTSCAAAPKIPAPEDPVGERPFWEKILDEVPWKNRIVGSIEADVNSLPNDLFKVMVKYGYRYALSTHKLRQEDGQGTGERFYEFKRENVIWYEEDDTFLFIGEFFPDESTIWLLFTKDEKYEDYAGPRNRNDKEYRFIKISGRAE